MPDNTPQDNLAEEPQTAEELQDQESVAEEFAAEDLAEQEATEQDLANQEPAAQDLVDQEPAAQESRQAPSNENARGQRARRRSSRQLSFDADASTVNEPAPKDITSGEKIVTKEPVAQEETAQELTAKESTDADKAATQEPAAEELTTEEFPVVQVSATQEEIVPEPTAKEPAVQESDESPESADSTPKTSVSEVSKPEPPQKKPQLETIDGYVDELSRELDLEFADETEESIEEQVDELVAVDDPAASDFDDLDIFGDQDDDSEQGAQSEQDEQADQVDKVDEADAPGPSPEELAPEPAPEEVAPELSPTENTLEQQQPVEKRQVPAPAKTSANTQVVKEATPSRRQARKEAQSTRRSARETPRKERRADPQAPHKERRDAQQAPQQRTKNKPQTRVQEPQPEPKAPPERITRTYLKSPSLKQAFHSFGKLKGGVAWRKVYAPVIMFMLLFALLSLAVVDSLPIVDSFNLTINTMVQQTRGPLDAFVITLTTIGDFLPMAGICLLVCVILYIGGKWDSLAYFIANTLLAIICIQALKLIFAVPRPGDETLVPLPLSFSFPSAHSFCSLVIFGLVGLLIFRALYARGISRNVAMAPGVVLVVLALFIGLSRIYVGVHWPSDVLGGWLLAGAWLAFAGALYTAGARQR